MELGDGGFAGHGGYQSTYWEGQSSQETGLHEVAISEESVPGNNGSASAGGPRSWRQSRDFTPEEYRGRLVDPETAARATVGNAEKHGEGFKDAYVTYEVVSHFPTAGASCKMRRRYQDFMWLLGKLAAKSNGGVILPPLPDKNRLGFMDRFSPDYIRKRQQGLERFLNRLLSHPRLAGDPELKSFLTVPIIGVDSVQPVPSLESPTGMAAVVEHLSDAVISVFSRPRPVEERFLVMRRVVGIAEGHFERIAALHGKLVASYRGLSESLMSSGHSYTHVSSFFSQLERSLDSIAEQDDRGDDGDRGAEEDRVPASSRPLRAVLADYGQLLEEQSVAVASLADDLELKVHIPASEFGHYCRSAKQTLKTRDQRQIEWQDQSDSLESFREELRQLSGDAAARPGNPPDSNAAASTAGSTGSTSERLRAQKSAVVNFLTEKMDTLRGVDPISTRAERIKRLEVRVRELEASVAAAHQNSDYVNDTLDKDFCTFLAILDRDFKKYPLLGLSSSWTHFHRQYLELWEAFSRDTLEPASPALL